MPLDRVIIDGSDKGPVSGVMGGVFTSSGTEPAFVNGFSLQDITGNGISGLNQLQLVP